MVDPTPSDYNLTYLRERWERDKSSRIFLQLAEEYRRRGLHTEALEVLETGLGFHPGYLAAQVALGRCRLEAGQPQAAVKVLERVLTQDPTQAVATRLLAESWLQLGDSRQNGENHLSHGCGCIDALRQRNEIHAQVTELFESA